MQLVASKLTLPSLTHLQANSALPAEDMARAVTASAAAAPLALLFLALFAAASPALAQSRGGGNFDDGFLHDGGSRSHWHHGHGRHGHGGGGGGKKKPPPPMAPVTSTFEPTPSAPTFPNAWFEHAHLLRARLRLCAA